MRLPRTQELSDGELFYLIENGVRFTGMPAWGNGTPEGERASWELVAFLRHLPRLSAAEIAGMARQNPVSPAELREREADEAFLRGEDPAPSSAGSHGSADPHASYPPHDP
jgi:hypothetical protein